MHIIVTTTCANEAEADHLAEKLIEGRLAACVQITPIRSIYRWKDKMEKASEVGLTIKAREENYTAIEKLIKATVSYENPEVLSTLVHAGSGLYLDWINDNTQ